MPRAVPSLELHVRNSIPARTEEVITMIQKSQSVRAREEQLII
jgi:hypothetical protein